MNAMAKAKRREELALKWEQEWKNAFESPELLAWKAEVNRRVWIEEQKKKHPTLYK